VIVDKEYAIFERERQGYDTVATNISYTLQAWVEGLWLNGSKDIDATGNNGRNGLTGNEGDNTIRGMEGNDFLEGMGGDDLLDGGSGRDTAAFWDARGEIVVNLMKGYAKSEATGRDRLVSIENISAANSDDIFIGNDSANRLDPKNGDSKLTGNGGRDTFVFGFMAMGDHIITDFEDGVDMIEIRTGQHAWHSYKDLSSHIRQQGGDVVVAADGYDGRVSIRLLDTDIKDITAADFVFS
jgi:Ca2+-binding RTX toxin-like protein